MHQNMSPVPDKESESSSFVFDSEPLDLRRELKQVWGLIWPVTLSTMFRFIIGSTDSAFLGHLNTEALAGVMLARIWMTCLQTFAYNPSWVLNTLCSQAIGAGNPKLAGNWLQLAIAVALVMNFVCMGLFWLAGPILSQIAHDPNEIAYGTLFARLASLWLLPSVMFSVLSQYFNAMEIVIPEAIMGGVFVGVNILLNQTLINGLQIPALNISWNGMGFVGSPTATLTSTVLQFGCFWFIMFKWKKYHTNFWDGWTVKSFEWSRVKTFISMAGPLTLASGFELWGYQIVNIMTGRLPPAQTAGMSIAVELTNLGYSCFSGMGLAILVRVGFLMGAGQVKNCQTVVKYAMCGVLTVSSLVLLLSIVFRNYIGRIWSNDDEVSATVGALAPLVGAWFFVAAVGWVGISVLEGMGRTAIGAVICAVGVWGVVVPFGIWTGFYAGFRCGICWIWYVCVIAESLKAVAVWVVLLRSDWYAMSVLARKNAEVTDGDNDVCDVDDVEMEDVPNGDDLGERLLDDAAAVRIA